MDKIVKTSFGPEGAAGGDAPGNDASANAGAAETGRPTGPEAFEDEEPSYVPPPPGTYIEGGVLKTGARRSVRFGVGGKLIAALLLVFAFLGVATVWMVSGEMGTALKSEFRAKGEGIVKSLAKSLEDYVGGTREDKAGIDEVVNQFKQMEDLSFIAILGRDGEELASNMEDGLPDELYRELRKVHQNLMDTDETEGIPVREIAVSGYRVMNFSYPILMAEIGTAHVAMDLEKMERRVDEVVMKILTVFGLFLILGGLVVFLLSRMIVNPLFHVVAVLQEVSRGNLTVRASVGSRDELGVVAESVNQMIESLQDVVVRVRRTAEQVAVATQEIRGSAEEQERGALDQASTLEEVSQSMSSQVETARAIAGNSESLADLSAKLSEGAQTGQAAVVRAQSSMNQIVAQNEIVADRIKNLYEKGQAIINVIDIIDDISDRLDLLALNAALEGTRAGEVGRGFSLVAQEMRRLAESVTGSTSEIKRTVHEITTFTEGSLDASRENTRATEEGSNEIETMASLFGEIFRLIDTTKESSRQISVITQQQLANSQETVAAVQATAAISQKGLLEAKQINEATRSLADLNADLQSRVAVFQVTTDAFMRMRREQQLRRTVNGSGGLFNER